MDEGTLCLTRHGSAAPLSEPPGGGPAQPPTPAATLSPQTAAAGNDELAYYLDAIGKSRAPEKVRERVATVVRFFAAEFPGTDRSGVVDFLKGVDLSREVRYAPLASIAPHGSTLIQYSSGPRPGNFFSKPGHAVNQLGVAQGDRRFRRFRVISGSGLVLASTAAPMSDTWTQGRTANVHSPVSRPTPHHPPAILAPPSSQAGRPPARAGELVGGGGLQIVIPHPVDRFVAPLDPPAS